MRQHVTVVPTDQLIIVDGEALHFAFDAPVNLHALQWHDGAGHMEFTDVPHQPLAGAGLYTKEVAPYVALWEGEKARVEQQTIEAEAARLAVYNSRDARAARVRAERDRRIAATDYLMTPDYPLTGDARSAWIAYRTVLRDITAQEGFPWDGGGEETLWPQRPSAVQR